MDSLNWYGIASNTEKKSEIIVNLLLASQVLINSKARATALASAVKIDESSGISCILLWLSDITAQPTFESSLQLSRQNYPEGEAQRSRFHRVYS